MKKLMQELYLEFLYKLYRKRWRQWMDYYIDVHQTGIHNPKMANHVTKMPRRLLIDLQYHFLEYTDKHSRIDL